MIFGWKIIHMFNSIYQNGICSQFMLPFFQFVTVLLKSFLLAPRKQEICNLKCLVQSIHKVDSNNNINLI